MFDRPTVTSNEERRYCCCQIDILSELCTTTVESTKPIGIPRRFVRKFYNLDVFQVTMSCWEKGLRVQKTTEWEPFDQTLEVHHQRVQWGNTDI